MRILDDLTIELSVNSKLKYIYSDINPLLNSLEILNPDQDNIRYEKEENLVISDLLITGHLVYNFIERRPYDSDTESN